MKITKVETEKENVFEPITIQITIENIDEYKTLFEMTSMEQEISDFVCRKCTFDESVEGEIIVRFLDDIWNILDRFINNNRK